MAKPFSRRFFLCLSAQIAACAVINPPLESLALQTGKKDQLVLFHTHTGESLRIDIKRPRPNPFLRKKINHFLRDFRTGETHSIDPGLIDLLCQIHRKSGGNGVFEVISGYRSVATNQKLRQKSSGVAKKSLHMKGQAIDIRLTTLKTAKLRDLAWKIRKGGVGYYARSDFVHLDTGRIRRW